MAVELGHERPSLFLRYILTTLRNNVPVITQHFLFTSISNQSRVELILNVHNQRDCVLNSIEEHAIPEGYLNIITDNGLGSLPYKH